MIVYPLRRDLLGVVRGRRSASCCVIFFLGALLYLYVVSPHGQPCRTACPDQPPWRNHGQFGLYRIPLSLDPDNSSDATFLADIEFVEESVSTLDQTDTGLVRYVRTHYLSPPSDKPYNFAFTEGSIVVPTEFSQWARNFFQDKEKGVFVEVGAHEGGPSNSHTLELELELGWTGMLIECNPTLLQSLKGKHRKAWLAGVCLSTTPNVGKVNFSIPDGWSWSGRVGSAYDVNRIPTTWNSVVVEAVPLYTLLAAARLTLIDFFVFDIEGMERRVLESFPFHLIHIQVILVEIHFLTEAERKELTSFMDSKGYTFYQHFSVDYIFVQKGLERNLDGGKVGA